MSKTIRSVGLMGLLLVALATIAGAAPIMPTDLQQTFVSEDQFADSRYFDSTSNGNYPYGQYLWSGHQQYGDVHSYTFLRFEVGENWNWKTTNLILPFNHFYGDDGETAIWFNPNDDWTAEDVRYGNLENIWDYGNPLLLAREFVPQSQEDVAPFSFDISSLFDLETNGVVSLVVGSILPDEQAMGNYWRDIVNSDYPYGPYAAKMVGMDFAKPVPEPATLFLLGLGLLWLAAYGRKEALATIRA